MKKIFKPIFFILAVTMLFGSCKKIIDDTDSLPAFAKAGMSVTLTSSATSIAPVMSDSDHVAVVFSWTDPGYAVDSSTVKYIIEIDSSGRNFAKEVTRTITGTRSTSFLAKELNNILLGFGFAYNTTYNIDVRVTSSYSNNNQRYQSNVVTIGYKTYVVPPKVVPPSSNKLFLVGSATAGGWDNPVPLPAQGFTRVDSVTYQGTFYLNGGGEYLLLPVNGDWTHKFSVADKTLPGLSAGGSFGADLSDNIPGPAATGMYKITVDFQHGTFTCVLVKAYGLLYVPGDYQGWSPATAHTLGSPNSDGAYEGYVNFPAGGTFEFKFTTTPDWSNALGDGGGGTLSSSGGNLTVPAAGYYKLNGNTANNTWSATKTTWSLIGSFAASGWSNDVDMTYDAGSGTWSGTITTAAGDQFKFRANHDWGLNYGDTGVDGSLEPGGDNIVIGAGTHTIKLYLNNSGYYTYRIQ